MTDNLLTSNIWSSVADSWASAILSIFNILTSAIGWLLPLILFSFPVIFIYKLFLKNDYQIKEPLSKINEEIYNSLEKLKAKTNVKTNALTEDLYLLQKSIKLKEQSKNLINVLQNRKYNNIFNLIRRKKWIINES